MASTSTPTWQSAGLFRIGRAFASVALALAETLFNLPANAFWAAVRMQKRYETRRHLAHLDDRLLNDVGLSRADARRQAERPVWIP